MTHDHAIMAVLEVQQYRALGAQWQARAEAGEAARNTL
jgi:hypothetical protein